MQDCVCVYEFAFDMLFQISLIAELTIHVCVLKEGINFLSKHVFLHMVCIMLTEKVTWSQNVFTGNYILNYVASQPKLAPFVIQVLIQVIAKITKSGWFEVQKDQFVFRELTADVKKFLQVKKHYYNTLLEHHQLLFWI